LFLLTISSDCSKSKFQWRVLLTLTANVLASANKLEVLGKVGTAFDSPSAAIAHTANGPAGLAV
jgi:hypothetical protein